MRRQKQLRLAEQLCEGRRRRGAAARHPAALMGQLPPAVQGDLAFRRFCTPRLSSHRSADHDVLTARARHHLQRARWVEVASPHGVLQAYVFEPDVPVGGPMPPSVVVAHGWTSESSFMSVFAEQLRRAGFRVVAFDQPGHGKSAGERASLVDCARGLAAVARALGPFQSVVAHSMGGLAALMVGEGMAPLDGSYPFERYVLVAVPNRFSVVTQEFADELGLSRAGNAAFERRLERIAHRTVGRFTAAGMLGGLGARSLLLHARDDGEVRYAEALEIAASVPGCEIKGFDGFGHRNILFASPVIRAAIAFLARS